MRTTLASSARQRLLLQPPQLGAAAHGEIEQRIELRPVERHALGSALHLDEAPVAGADDVHVRLGGDVLLVAKGEPRRALDHAHPNSGDRRHHWLPRPPPPPAPPPPP